MSTIKVSAIKNASSSDGGIAIDASGHVTVDGQQLPTDGQLSSRNKIINGAMVHDQRNGGGAVTHSGSSNLYVLIAGPATAPALHSFLCSVSLMGLLASLTLQN